MPNWRSTAKRDLPTASRQGWRPWLDYPVDRHVVIPRTSGKGARLAWRYRNGYRARSFRASTEKGLFSFFYEEQYLNITVIILHLRTITVPKPPPPALPEKGKRKQIKGKKPISWQDENPRGKSQTAGGSRLRVAPPHPEIRAGASGVQ